MTEQQLFVEGQFVVTTARVITPQETFAVAGITSVRVYQQEVKTGCPLLVFIAGLLFLLGCVMGLAFGQGDDQAYLWLWVFLTIPFIVWSVWRLIGTRPWILGLATAGGERPAYTSPDRAFIDRLAAAITQAMVQRG